jgi:membrane protein YqaA with SNARE-associated domain
MDAYRPLLTISALASLAGHTSPLVHFFLSLGILGLFLVSIVDSSFVPLPIPGITDIMLVLYAAQHAQPILLIASASVGSALGGYFSYKVGQSGGLAFIEKRTPKRIFERVTRWMESHAIWAVALPALLPPPMPLSPFVLAAGALKMSLRTFMIAFTTSRLLRHTIAVLLGIHYGKAVLHLWFRFTARYGTLILMVLWSFILISVGVAFYQLWKTSHSVRQTAMT